MSLSAKPNARLRMPRDAAQRRETNDAEIEPVPQSGLSLHNLSCPEILCAIRKAAFRRLFLLLPASCRNGTLVAFTGAVKNPGPESNEGPPMTAPATALLEERVNGQMLLLSLTVSDPVVISYLAHFDGVETVQEKAIEALRIGVTPIQSASPRSTLKSCRRSSPKLKDGFGNKWAISSKILSNRSFAISRNKTGACRDHSTASLATKVRSGRPWTASSIRTRADSAS